MVFYVGALVFCICVLQVWGARFLLDVVSSKVLELIRELFGFGSGFSAMVLSSCLGSVCWVSQCRRS